MDSEASWAGVVRRSVVAGGGGAEPSMSAEDRTLSEVMDHAARDEDKQLVFCDEERIQHDDDDDADSDVADDDYTGGKDEGGMQSREVSVQYIGGLFSGADDGGMEREPSEAVLQCILRRRRSRWGRRAHQDRDPDFDSNETQYEYECWWKNCSVLTWESRGYLLDQGHGAAVAALDAALQKKSATPSSLTLGQASLCRSRIVRKRRVASSEPPPAPVPPAPVKTASSDPEPPATAAPAAAPVPPVRPSTTPAATAPYHPAPPRVTPMPRFPIPTFSEFHVTSRTREIAYAFMHLADGAYSNHECPLHLVSASLYHLLPDRITRSGAFCAAFTGDSSRYEVYMWRKEQLVNCAKVSFGDMPIHHLEWYDPLIEQNMECLRRKIAVVSAATRDRVRLPPVPPRAVYPSGSHLWLAITVGHTLPYGLLVISTEHKI